jgi:hypothetical protein
MVVREGQNIELHRDSRTTLANLADHQWSAEQTLGSTGLVAIVLDNAEMKQTSKHASNGQ